MACLCSGAFLKFNFRKLNWSPRQKKQKKSAKPACVSGAALWAAGFRGMFNFFFAQVFHLSITPLIAELSLMLLLNLRTEPHSGFSSLEDPALAMTAFKLFPKWL